VVIDPALDVWVWIGVAVFLALLGARAWIVETGRRQLGGTPTKVRALTIASGLVACALAVLVMMQGGALLVQALVTGSDPIALLGGSDNQPVPNGQGPALPGGGAPAPAPGGGAPAAPGGG
jgi:hypothetical protein